MKTIFYIMLALFTSNLCFGQKVSTVNEKKVCKIDDQFLAKPVDNFKESLKLLVKITSVSEGKITEASDLEYTEMILNNSSIIQISINLAISISVERIEEKTKKYYIERIHMYKRENKCWRDLTSSNNWNMCGLGSVNGGKSIGVKGTDNYWGYEGTISLE